MQSYFAKSKYKAVSYSPKQLQNILKQKDKYVVIDVRSKKEYDKGKLVSLDKQYVRDYVSQLGWNKSPPPPKLPPCPPPPWPPRR